jgi:hypothetical protein
MKEKGDFTEGNEVNEEEDYLFAPARIMREIPSISFTSWKLIKSPMGILSSFM